MPLWGSLGLADDKKVKRNPFQQHVMTLIWKSYLQRQRRWRLLVLETIIAAILFTGAVYVARPFLDTISDEPEPSRSFNSLLNAYDNRTAIGYAPNTEPYKTIMNIASGYLKKSLVDGIDSDELESKLEVLYEEHKIRRDVIWVLFQEKREKMWQYTIRSSESTYPLSDFKMFEASVNLRSGFLAVEVAVNKAICDYVAHGTIELDLHLTSMPASTFMDTNFVRRLISLILMCYTLALLPPIMETEAVVVTETMGQFKRALFMRDVSYCSMYIGWLFYGLFSALPIYILGSMTLILIFRWIHLITALVTLLAYGTVMMMMVMIMSMFHTNPMIACLWSTMSTILQTFLAQLLVYHRYDEEHHVLTFILHMLLPPLGLLHGFNHFALLETVSLKSSAESNEHLYTLLSWIFMIFLYFVILMLLQRTIGRSKAIGGQVSWKSIVFKHAEDKQKVRRIRPLSGKERENLQDVDELVAKAVSFRNVSKDIMGETILKRLNFDIYRGEHSLFYTQKLQENMLRTLEDLLTGLTTPDIGTINILGEFMSKDVNFITECYMTGYCHPSNFLHSDLTVEEHLNLYADICMWKKSTDNAFEYTQIRIRRLLHENNLLEVRDNRIRNIDMYYRAQLCWAIAMFLEPRVVIVPPSADDTVYKSVIRDKIMHYKGFITIIKFSSISLNIEYADRSFLFHNGQLHFGGTSAYMFLKYGREYRIRITLNSSSFKESTNKLLKRAEEAGAAVRAHLGALLILRMPTAPTHVVSKLIQDLDNHCEEFGITSMNITLPDSEEVCSRAIFQSQCDQIMSEEDVEKTNAALKKIDDSGIQKRTLIKCQPKYTKSRTWQREEGKSRREMNTRLFRIIAWKFFSFYVHYRIFFVITVMLAITAGIALGLSLGRLIKGLDKLVYSYKRHNGSVLNIESTTRPTVLVIGMDNTSEAKTLGSLYALSQTYATQKDVELMSYTTIIKPDSLREYLIHRVIDSPEDYALTYGFGIEAEYKDGVMGVKSLFSPLHTRKAGAAKSLSRAFMAIIRYYSNELDASIQITDKPLIFRLIRDNQETPIFWIQFLLILTIAHITVLPSKERKLVRHVQTHASNSSPLLYWLSLYTCDLILYWLVAAIISVFMVTVLIIVTDLGYFKLQDIIVVPFVIIIYGFGCIPMAYVFSLGPNEALNTMAFVMFNIVMGEITIFASYLSLFVYDHLLITLLIVNPQLNMASALMKIRQTYLYNNECRYFKRKKLCEQLSFNKCCKKCGIVTDCFKRRHYLSGGSHGILMEVCGTLVTSLVFLGIMFILEYKVPQRIRRIVLDKVPKKMHFHENDTIGNLEEQTQVLEKQRENKNKNLNRSDYGEYLLATGVGRKTQDKYFVRDVSFGIGKGEVLALSGLKRHGRLKLCRILAGYKTPHHGDVWCMSKYRLIKSPFNYARHVSFCCDDVLVPSWMTVYDCLDLIGTLRGVPEEELKSELTDYIDALELSHCADTLICRLRKPEVDRVNFLVAVIGAPPILVLDEYSANQSDSVRRAMICVLHRLKKRGHAMLVGSMSVERILPMTNRLAIIIDGRFFDIGELDSLLDRYTAKGCTVVVQLKQEVDVSNMFTGYFHNVVTNDQLDLLANVQVLDDVNMSHIFIKMEEMKAQHDEIYDYIITYVPIDYVYNQILGTEQGLTESIARFSCPPLLRKLFGSTPVTVVTANKEMMDKLVPFQSRYNIRKLAELPWSVIFQR